jgi:hypothetical protein
MRIADWGLQGRSRGQSPDTVLRAPTAGPAEMPVRWIAHDCAGGIPQSAIRNPQF